MAGYNDFPDYLKDMIKDGEVKYEPGYKGLSDFEVFVQANVADFSQHIPGNKMVARHDPEKVRRKLKEFLGETSDTQRITIPVKEAA